MKTITIDASKARNDFFNLLNKVFLEDMTFVIKKAGIPVAKITKPDAHEKSDVMKFAGILRDAPADEIIAYIYEARKDRPKTKRGLPEFDKDT